MNYDSPTCINTLELENFRCFSTLNVQFHKKLTVIVAPNGGGKTSLLDAASFAWRPFIQGIEFNDSSKGFTQSDIRLALTSDGGMQPIKPVSLRVTSRIQNVSVSGAIHKGNTTQVRTSTLDAEEIKSEGRNLRWNVQNYAQGKIEESPVLPILGYYGTGRLWAAEKITDNKKDKIKPDTSRTGGYHDCLSPSSHFGLFQVWFERYSHEAVQEAMNNTTSPQQPSQRLLAVTRAVDTILRPTGWHNLSFDFTNKAVAARHGIHGRLPVSMLSDGIRAMIGLVGDIAHRCVRLNPDFGADAALLTPGVVMIDEIDMHLHPEWQQLVLPALLEAFPLIQFIVTTHSPQVLSTVHKENIRILTQGSLGEWTSSEPHRNPYAHASSLSLEMVMGVTAYPPLEITENLREYQRLVGENKHDTAPAITLRKILEKAWGKGDPELVLMDVSIRKNETLRKFSSQRS